MSQNPTTNREESQPNDKAAGVALGVLKVARYVLNGGATRQGNPLYEANNTYTLDGPTLDDGDLILQVVTDCVEAFSDADDQDNTTIQLRFNDGSTQTDIQAATSIGGNPFNEVRQDLMVQNLATEGNWLRLTLPTRVEVLIGNDEDIDSGLMYIYVLFVGGE